MPPNSHKYLILVRFDWNCAFSSAPRSAIINGVLCLLTHCKSYNKGQSVLLPQNGSHPQFLSSIRLIPNKKAPTRVLVCLVRSTGIEPAWSYPQDPQSCASASSATTALTYHIIANVIAFVNSFYQIFKKILKTFQYSTFTCGKRRVVSFIGCKRDKTTEAKTRQQPPCKAFPSSVPTAVGKPQKRDSVKK